MKVSVFYSPAPRIVREWTLDVPPGTSVGEALQGTELLSLLTYAQRSTLRLGVWGQAVSSQTSLQPGDRLEVYRSLVADPKVARRERFKRQGSKGAGLFANLRAGGKAGY